MSIKKNIVIVGILTLIGAFLHFYNLNWGAPFYFHPDERNIAFSVSQLVFSGKFTTGQFNPHFFAYGSLPIYSIFFYGFLSSLLFSPDNPLARLNFEMAIYISRMFSAFFATLLIPVMFFIGKKIKNENTGLIAAFLTTFSTGIIQFAHFGTFEIWLTFFTTLLFWCCLFIKQHPTTRLTIILAILTGILVSIKISHLAILPIALLVITIQEIFQNKIRHHFFKIIMILKGFFLFFLITLFIYLITNPYTFLDTKSFLSTMQYESSLALGTLPVFYTGEFYNTLPIIFQFLHVYPFLLNPIIELIFIASFLYLLIKILKTKNITLIFLLSFYALLFFSQAILFVKWTRYMIPTLPFMFLTIAVAISDFSFQIKSQGLKKYFFIIISLMGVITLIFSISYFITAFIKPDTRIAAYTFAKKNIPTNAKILSEVYDLGIVPFNDPFGSITLFNFYDLDNELSSPELKQELAKDLNQSEYIILPSQRIIKTRIINKEKFSAGNIFYSRLTSGDLAFKKVYETSCDIFCKITYLGSPIYSFEQTANVFDRPTVMIFKKI